MFPEFGNGLMDVAVTGSDASSGNPLLSVFLQTDPPGPADPPTDVTASFSITSTGLIYSRVTQSYHGTITVINTSGLAVAGPLDLAFQILPSGVSLISPTGSAQGAPYLALPNGMVAGQSANLPVQFSDPGNVSLTFTNKVYSGSLK